jgi:hypothetical protein
VDAETNIAIIWELLKAGARCDIHHPYDDETFLDNFLDGVVVQHEYYTTDISGITAPVLMLKACGTGSEPLEHFIKVMRNYLKVTDEQRSKIFKHEKGFHNFNAIFQLVIMCGSKPSSDFVDKYRQVILKGTTGQQDGADWLDDIVENGYTLKQLSRIKLRQMIRHPLVTNAMSEMIPLPTLLKKYILFDDIFPF